MRLWQWLVGLLRKRATAQPSNEGQYVDHRAQKRQLSAKDAVFRTDPPPH